jgi:outer membrane protein assembly factor BamB
LRWVAELTHFGVQGFFVTPVFSHEGYVGGVSTDGKVIFFERDSGALALPVLDLPGASGPASEAVPPGLLAGGLLAPAFIQPMWDLIYGREIEVANTPAVHPDNGRIFITAAGASPQIGVLYGIDTGAAGADIAFAAPLGAGSGTSPTISPDGTLVYAIDDAGVMVALDTTTGERAWEAHDTMGAASPSVGPDGTIYSFNGIAGTVVAIDGANGQVKWRQQYDALAAQHLRWMPFLPRVATVDGIITVTDNGIWAFMDLNYRISADGQDYPQPRKVILARLDPADGDVLGWFPVPDTSGALAVPDAQGNWYLSLTGTASSIAWYGVNPRLPGFLQTDLQPTAGLVALRPRP